MAIRVGINGFGRMGKLALRAGWDSDEISGDAHCHAHLLQFDSIHGRWGDDKAISVSGDEIVVAGKTLSFSQYISLVDVDWQSLIPTATGSAKEITTYFMN